MTVSYWQYSAKRLPSLSLDVAIIGGGIVGSSVAYALHRIAPSLRVGILDACTLAHGASGRNAGFLLHGTDSNYARDVQRYGEDIAAQIWACTRENISDIGALFDSRDTGYTPSGSWKLAGSPEEAEELERSAQYLKQMGESVTYVPAEALSEWLPVRGFYGGLWVPQDACAHSVRLVRHIAEQSRALLLEHHAVVRIEHTGTSWVLDTNQREVQATRIVLALNAYLPQLVPEYARYIRPVRAQMLAVEASLDGYVPVTSHREAYYFRQLPEGKLLIGGARHLFKEQEVGYSDEVTPELQQALEAYLHRHILLDASSLNTVLRWSGTMGFSPDGLPVVGKCEAGDGVWVGGFSGHGMSLGFRVGKMVALLMEGISDTYESLFSVSRLNNPG